MLLKWLMTQNYTAKATKEFHKAKKFDIFQCPSVIWSQPSTAVTEDKTERPQNN